MADTKKPGLQKAGSVDIVDLKIIGSTGKVIDLKDFLVELNVYEDIFSNTLYGDIVLSDSRNLIDFLPIIGEEYITVHFRTPSFEKRGDFIKKTFRVYRLSNRTIVRDNNTQLFTLHFASMELFFDMVLPVYKSFEGNVSEVALDVFNTYLKTPRNFDLSADEKKLETKTAETSFYVAETDNNIKFVSPGWTPLKIINWLASKAMPKEDTKAKDYLFFETTKSFYFISLEKIFKNSHDSKNIVDVYTYAASNLKEDKSPNIRREMALANSVEMVESNDYIKNYTNGYLINRLITLDVFNKKYELIDYDYTEDYKNNYHTSGEGKDAIPLFNLDGLKSPGSSVSFYPVNPRLFQNSTTDYFKDNISEKMKDIYGNRKSSLLGMTNVKLNVTVPGRTDIEVGRMLYFKFPGLGPKSPQDQTETTGFDKAYSGKYLITAVHHRVTSQEHVIMMEIVKDSLKD